MDDKDRVPFPVCDCFLVWNNAQTPSEPKKKQKFRSTVGLSRRIRKPVLQDGEELSYLDCWQPSAHQEGNIYSCRDTALRAALGLLCCTMFLSTQIAVAVWEQFLFVLVIVPRNVRPYSTNATSLSKKGHATQQFTHVVHQRWAHIYFFTWQCTPFHYETGSCVHVEFSDKASSCSTLLTFHAYFYLIYQVSDCSQSQYATLRPGVWSEHLHGSAASVSDHSGGGGLSWTWPRCLHSGLEAISSVVLVYFTSHWWSSCIFFPSVLHLRWILCHHIFSLLHRWG